MTNLPPLTPELARRYEPTGILGYGAFATVLAARNRQTGERVAIKHIPAGGKGRMQFLTELHLTMDLVHPNIVRCMDLCSADEEWSSLVLEYADSGSLRDRLEHGRLTVDQAWRALGHVALGLAEAHAHNIVHRDLKPENILCFSSAEGCCFKISDFGIARSLDLLERAQTNIGSPGYMAPEQFYDEYGPRCDVYALGIIFFELLHGHPPYQGSPAKVFKSHLESPLPIDSECDPLAAIVLRSLTAKRPQDRPSAKELLAELQRVGKFNPPTLINGVNGARRGEAPFDLSAGKIFGEAFGTDSPPPILTSSRDDPSTDDPGGRATTSVRAADFFDDIFDDTPQVISHSAAGRVGDSPLKCGALAIERSWSRATETTTRRLINFDDGRGPFVVAETSAYELRSDATRGDALPLHAALVIGTPSGGNALIATADSVQLLLRRQLIPLDWALSAEVDDLLCAPQLQAAAIRRGQEIYYHRADGSLGWHGSVDHDSSEVWCGFDNDDRLLVAAIGAGDGALQVFDADGRELATYPLPGPIDSISQCRFGSGCWAIVRSSGGPQLVRLTADGILGEPRPISLYLQDLLGARGWIAGLSHDGTLHVVDPATGISRAISIEGAVVDYEQGAEEDELYVLEQRGELLRYITAFHFSPTA